MNLFRVPKADLSPLGRLALRRLIRGTMSLRAQAMLRDQMLLRNRQQSVVLKVLLFYGATLIRAPFRRDVRTDLRFLGPGT
jgi:hypothetical protein